MIETAPNFNLTQLKQQLTTDTHQMAIVVLSAGRYPLAKEYDGIDVVNAKTLQRTLYASWIEKKIGLPILLSGGSENNEPTSEAVLMNQTLIASFSIAPFWIEAKSQNLFEKSRNSAEILKENNISTVILITHANEMASAKYLFELNGIRVIPAPVGYTGRVIEGLRLVDFLPSAQALSSSNQSIFELLRYKWYQIRF